MNTRVVYVIRKGHLKGEGDYWDHQYDCWRNRLDSDCYLPQYPELPTTPDEHRIVPVILKRKEKIPCPTVEVKSKFENPNYYYVVVNGKEVSVPMNEESAKKYAKMLMF